MKGRGFTLLEVVMALLVLEVAVLGVTGALALASRTLGRAERMERAVALAEGVLDSLDRVAAPVDGAHGYEGGEVLWAIGDSGDVVLSALGPAGDTLFELTARLPSP
jgi:type II secretory pathway pseudopilin PulG